MIKAEQIPAQVIAAFDRVFLEERQSGWTLDMAYRHAFVAAIDAWPVEDGPVEVDADGYLNGIYLPLPKEPQA